MEAADDTVSWAELSATVLSRDLADGEIGSPGGARSEIAFAAARLAQLTHAPNLTILASAVGYVINGQRGRPEPLRSSTTDYRNIHVGAEAVLGFGSIFQSRRDWFFAGGLQVDAFGNLNMTVVGDRRSPKLHGPGGAGLAYASGCASRYYIYMNEHTPRSFVERVDYVTALGYGTGGDDRERAGLAGGPRLVVTPRAVLDFDDATRRMRLRSVHPGHSVDDVVANTGCQLVLPTEVPDTPAPRADELELLRTVVDPDGVLRRR